MFNEICLQKGRQVELNVFKLFCINEYLKETKKEVEQKQERLQNLKETREEAEELLKQKMREKTTLSLDMTGNENYIKEMVGNVLLWIIDYM